MEWETILVSVANTWEECDEGSVKISPSYNCEKLNKIQDTMCIELRKNLSKIQWLHSFQIFHTVSI